MLLVRLKDTLLFQMQGQETTQDLELVKDFSVLHPLQLMLRVQNQKLLHRLYTPLMVKLEVQEKLLFALVMHLLLQEM